MTALSEKDIAMLAYARQLKTVNAEGCTDYETLELLRQTYPDLEVNYSVAFSCGNYSWDVDTLLLNSVAQEDIQLLKHLPNLQNVVLETGSYDARTVDALRGTVHNAGAQFGVLLGGEIRMDTETTLQVSGITDEDIAMLQFLPVLETLHLQNPQADPRQILAMPPSEAAPA